MRTRVAVRLAVAVLAAALVAPSQAATTPAYWTESDRREFQALDERGGAGDYAAQLELARSFLARVESEGRGEDLVAADILDTMVMTLMRSGRASDPETLRLANRGLAVCEKELGPDGLEVVRSLGHRASVYAQIDRLSEAKADFERAITIMDRTHGARPELRAALRVNYANLLADTGEYTRARDLYEQNIAEIQSTYGPDHLELWVPLNNLGLVLADLGDLERARDLYARALAIVERELGPDHPETAIVLDSEAATFFALGENARARADWARSLAIREARLGPDNLRVAGNLDNLAQVLILDGDLEAAQGMLDRAIGIWTKALGAESPTLAPPLDNYGDLEAARGRWEEARSRYAAALRLREHGLGLMHPLLARPLGGLARAEAALGHAPEALAASLRAERIVRDHLRRMVRHLSESQALDYETILASGLDVAQSVLAGSSAETGSAAVAPVWDAVVQSRALVLDEMASRHRTLLGAASSRTAEPLDALEAARAALATLLLAGPGTSDDFETRFTQASLRVDDAERAAAEVSLAFRSERAGSRAGLAQVTHALPEGAALVAFSLYRRNPRAERQGDPHYLAYVQPPGRAAPRSVALGPAASIDALVEAWHAEASRPPSDAEALARYGAAGMALRKAAWDPIAPFLKGSRLILVVPDGRLHLVHFATLPRDRGGYLLEDGAAFQYLSAERDAAAMPASAARAASGLLMIGGVDFDATPAPDDDGASAPVEAYRGVLPSCALIKELTFPPLPSSGDEVDAIAGLWRARFGGAPGHDVTILRGTQAGEAAFKRLAPRNRDLHLATHAMSIGESCEKVSESGALRRRLQLAGLALAGANRGRGPEEHPDGEDGILTSEEIASLDLRGVDWVVLSGCRTGLGPVLRGEGIFGLRRTFAIAGARTLVTSLWPVGDHDARKWMTALYGARLEGRSAADAIRQAGLAMLAARRDAGAEPHPYYWGAFVASGDSR